MFNKRISLSKLKSKDVSEIARFAYIVDPIEFVHEFNKVGIEIGSFGDVNKLVELHKRGGDVNGEIKKSDKITSVVFDVLKVLENIDISKEEIDKAQIIWID